MFVHSKIKFINKLTTVVMVDFKIAPVEFACVGLCKVRKSHILG